jgi:hypothetical protein
LTGDVGRGCGDASRALLFFCAGAEIWAIPFECSFDSAFSEAANEIDHWEGQMLGVGTRIGCL